MDNTKVLLVVRDENGMLISVVDATPKPVQVVDGFVIEGNVTRRF